MQKSPYQVLNLLGNFNMHYWIIFNFISRCRKASILIGNDNSFNIKSFLRRWIYHLRQHHLYLEFTMITSVIRIPHSPPSYSPTREYCQLWTPNNMCTETTESGLIVAAALHHFNNKFNADWKARFTLSVMESCCQCVMILTQTPSLEILILCIQLIKFRCYHKITMKTPCQY